MAVWLVRAGSHGEFEKQFIQGNRIYVTWDDLDVDLRKLANRDDLIAALLKLNPDSKQNALRNWASQIWPFAWDMKSGDMVVLPLKTQPGIYIGEITGNYSFDAAGPNPYFHWRSVKWIGEAIPRERFGQDLLYSFGAFMTICRIQRNDAENRLKQMRANGWKAESLKSIIPTVASDETEKTELASDLEQLASDQISRLIMSRLKGHGLARLVEAILKAQGYTTFRSKDGPDGGVDILAGSGQLGFGETRICVQVKSQDSPIESKSITELLGSMKTVNADQGLFVAWGGYKSSVYKMESTNFFSLRLWTQKELLEALFAHYDQLDAELRAELPLKRIWTVATQPDT